jgi:hypothetical protein
LYLKKFLKESAWQVVHVLIRYILSVFPLLFCITLSNAWAGFIFEFHPLLYSEERYNDNIYLTRSNKRSDWITTVSPGFITSLIHPRLDISLEYEPGFVYFLHNPQHDFTRQEVNFNSTIRITPRLTLSLVEMYLRANEPEFEELLETDYERRIRRDTRITFNRNIFSPQFEYRFGRENLIRLYYRNTSYRSGDHAEDDYRENYFESKLEYWFNIRNGINLLCHYTKGNFDLDTDILYSADITARYIHRFTPHFELYGEYGVGVTDFEERRFFESLDERREFQVDSEDVEDYDLHRFNAGFEWQLPRNFRIEGGIGYFWRQGVGNRDDQGINSLIEIEKTTRNLTVNVRWESGYSANFFAVSDAGFSEYWRLSTDLTYSYREKLEFRCSGSYGYDEYTYGREGVGFVLDEREDYRYAANAAITYHILRSYFFIRDLSLEIEFNHVELDSSFDRDYYINNQWLARITATF